MKVWLIKFGRVLLSLVGVFRQMLCCFRRRRRNSDTPLPITVKDGDVHHIPNLSPNNIDTIVGSHSWVSWDDTESPSGITVIGNRNVTQNGLQRHPSVPEAEEPEIDFFQDMTPTINKPNKILLRKPYEEKSFDAMDSSSLSKRFAADSFVPLVNSAELGHWNEAEVGWEDSLSKDMDHDADVALKESKLMERERRAAENLRKKQAKDALRTIKKDHLATKIS